MSASGGDIIVAASTAAGKTEAAFLPLLSEVLLAPAPASGGFDLLYIGPFKALINDQARRLQDICAQTGLPVTPWHGDVDARIKAARRRDPRGVILSTPESIEAMFVRRGGDMPRLFRNLKAVVIDEMHALLDNERGIHLRSLMTRLEGVTQRRIRRVGLSATLGDMALARAYLRPEDPGSVTVIEGAAASKKIHVRLRAYGGEKALAQMQVAENLFLNLRGKRSMVFAGSRADTERYGVALGRFAKRAGLPDQFHVHHSSLASGHRVSVEKAMKTNEAATVVCTSTLELGIDIGDVECVAQIGAPNAIASLRQRLGRSGRREGKPSILHMYAVCPDVDEKCHLLDWFRMDLVCAIACVELLLSGWCEPPARHALHLSTLVHQVLSVVAERGQIAVADIYTILCRQGPFRTVDAQTFVALIGRLEAIRILEPAGEAGVQLAIRGQRVVGHYSFYSVFQTQEEFSIVHGKHLLGTMPMTEMAQTGATFMFSGKTWTMVNVARDKKTIFVEPGGQWAKAPSFYTGGGASGGMLHDKILETARDVLLGVHVPEYLDPAAQMLLDDARAEFQAAGFDQKTMCPIGKTAALVATWTGTVRNSTLALALRSRGFGVSVYDGFMEVRQAKAEESIAEAFQYIASAQIESAEQILSGKENLATEKFHSYLDKALLIADACGHRLDVACLPALAERVLRGMRDA